MPEWPPKPSQIFSKIHSKINQKINQILNRFFIDFGSILGSNLGAPGVQRTTFWIIFLALGANLGQLGPTWPTWANLGQLGANLGPTWSQLGAILSHLGLTWGQLGPQKITSSQSLKPIEILQSYHDDFFPTQESEKTYNFINIIIQLPMEKTYTDRTGRFMYQSSRGHNYVMVSYDYDANSILVYPLKIREATTLTEAWNIFRTCGKTLHIG